MKATTLHMLRTATLTSLKATAEAAKKDRLTADAQAVDTMIDFLRRSTLPTAERPYGDLVTYQKTYFRGASGGPKPSSQQDLFILIASNGSVSIKGNHTTVTDEGMQSESFEPTTSEMETFLREAIVDTFKSRGIVDDVA